MKILNGTMAESYGAAGHAFMALHFTTPGIPLIYSGQEYDLDKRLRFFEKDSFPKTKGKTLELLKQLGQLKNTHPALDSGVAGGSYERLQTTKDHQVLAFQRVKNQDTLLFIANLSNAYAQFTMDHNGEYKRFEDSNQTFIFLLPVR